MTHFLIPLPSSSKPQIKKDSKDFTFLGGGNNPINTSSISHPATKKIKILRSPHTFIEKTIHEMDDEVHKTKKQEFDQLTTIIKLKITTQNQKSIDGGK